jgi:hypothetical protein
MKTPEEWRAAFEKQKREAGAALSQQNGMIVLIPEPGLFFTRKQPRPKKQAKAKDNQPMSLLSFADLAQLMSRRADTDRQHEAREMGSAAKRLERQERPGRSAHRKYISTRFSGIEALREITGYEHQSRADRCAVELRKRARKASGKWKLRTTQN